MALWVAVIGMVILAATLSEVQSARTAPVVRQSTRYLAVVGASAVAPLRNLAVAVKLEPSRVNGLGIWMNTSGMDHHLDGLEKEFFLFPHSIQFALQGFHC